MSWAARFQLRQHFRQSLWAVPLLGAIAGAALAVVDLGVEARVTMPASWPYSPATASSVLTTVSGAMIGLLGLVVTVGVLVVQMATGTLSPRFMRLWYRDRLQKLVLAAFTATFAFSFALLGTVEAASVPNLGVTMAGLAVSVDLVLLLLYLDRFVHALRPVAVAASVARSGLAVVTEVDHSGIDLQAGDRSPRAVQGHKVQAGRGSRARSRRWTRAGWSTSPPGTTSRACSRARVGDFVNAGSVVMDVYGSPDQRVLRRLGGKIALGHERTIDQDPAYAVRIIVDIAIRALSPAVNDPTTATQMINYLGAVLIASFGLLPGNPGRGLGGALLAAVAGDAWARGARRVWLAHLLARLTRRAALLPAPRVPAVPRGGRLSPRLVVDASDVIGSRPDRWWRDRVGAARRLVASLDALAERTGDEVTVVLDAARRPVPARRGARRPPPRPQRRRRRDRRAARAARRRGHAFRHLRRRARPAGPRARGRGRGRRRPRGSTQPALLPPPPARSTRSAAKWTTRRPPIGRSRSAGTSRWPTGRRGRCRGRRARRRGRARRRCRRL